MEIRRFLIAAALALILLTPIAARSADSSVAEPLPLPGPYPVACSNVAQDFNRVAPGEDVQAYWEALPRDNGTPRFATDLLSDPVNALAVTVKAPNNSDLYGSYAGRNLPFVVLVCYPTTPANARPDYPLPTGRSVPRMQRGAEAPLLPDTTSRFPLLLFSHGYGGSPLSNDYIYALTVFASFGYVVAAPFHGDWQYDNVKLDSIGNLFYFIAHLADFQAMQALRPLSLSATIDLLLAHPQWRDRIDATEIGGFGASMGGESIMLMAGGGLTTSIGLSWTRVTKDARLKAAVGYVPYFGQPGFPAFGRDQRGLDGVTLPFLAISGTSDTSAPIALTLQGVARLGGARELVALVGVKHGFDVASTNDIFTWSVTFLDAEVRGDLAAREKLLRTTSVAGGGDDRVLIPYTAATPINFGGLWWNAPTGSESGWALDLAHQGDIIFATWATYDLTGKAWWLSMTASRVAGNAYSGSLYETRGPAFDAVPFDSSRVTLRAVGTGSLTFSDANSGTFSYTVDGVAQTKSVMRGVFASPVPVCTFGALANLALATNYQDVWSNAPLGSEPGWALNLTHQGETMFAIWQTYDVDGTPLWLSATLGKGNGASFAGTLYRTTGPAFSAVPFDPTRVVLTPLGTASLTFADGDMGAFSYTVNGVAQTKPITRYVFRTPGTVCQ